MNTKLTIFTFAALTLSLGSCRNDNDVTPVSNDKVPIKLTGSILETRAATALQSTQIDTSVHTGLFVVGATSSTTTIHYENVELTSDINGKFSSSTSSPLYYPIDGSDVSIYTYAPYNSAWTTFGVKTFTVNSDQSSDANYLASDLLYGAPSGSNQFSKSNTSAIEIIHTHKLAKVTLHFDVQDGTDLNGATINILNTLPSITLNTQSGKLGQEASGEATTIKAHVATTTDGEDASVILVPQTIAAQTPFIEIKTSDSKTLQVKLGDSGATFETGQAYTYTVTIKENLVEMNLKSILNNWGDGGSYSGEAKSASN